MKNLLRLLYEGVSVLHSSNESHSNNENKIKKKQIKFLFWMPNFAGIIGLKKTIQSTNDLHYLILCMRVYAFTTRYYVKSD